MAAIPLIGGDLPAIVRPRVRSAPPIPTFKITTPQQNCNNSINNNKLNKHLARAPLMMSVVSHCRVRPSSSCA